MNCLEYLFEEVVFVVLVPGTILFGLTSRKVIVLIEVRAAPSTPPLIVLIVGYGVQKAVSDKCKFIDNNSFSVT
jgi:hypothetical protein